MLVMLILLFFFLFLSNALILRRDKSMYGYNTQLVLAILIANIFIAFPLRTILDMISPHINSVFYTAVLMGLISSFCLVIKGLCTSGKIYSKFVILMTFSFSYLLGIITLGLDGVSILHTIHPLLLWFIA